MLSLGPFSLFATAAYAFSVQERAFIAPKAAVVELPRFNDFPESPSQFHPGEVSPGSTADIGAGAASGGSSIGRGTAPHSTNPFQSEEGPGTGGNKLLEEALERVEDVFDLLNNIVDLATSGDDDDDDGNDSPFAPAAAAPPSTNRTRAAADTTIKYSLTQGNVTYNFASDPRLLSKDVVADMAGPWPNRLDFQQDLLTTDEYDMFTNDPICFYANIERMYLAAARSSATTPSAAPTPSPHRRRQDSNDEDAGDSSDCVDPELPYGDTALYQVCSTSSDSPAWTSSQASSISSFWASQLPDQLWSAHFATPTAASGGEVTAAVTSTTSCAGLYGEGGLTTRYRELKVRGADTSSTSSGGDAVSTSREVSSVGVCSAEGRRSWLWVGAVIGLLVS